MLIEPRSFFFLSNQTLQKYITRKDTFFHNHNSLSSFFLFYSGWFLISRLVHTEKISHLTSYVPRRFWQVTELYSWLKFGKIVYTVSWVELSQNESNWVELSQAEPSWVKLSRAACNFIQQYHIALFFHLLAYCDLTGGIRI